MKRIISMSFFSALFLSQITMASVNLNDPALKGTKMPCSLQSSSRPLSVSSRDIIESHASQAAEQIKNNRVVRGPMTK